MAKILCHFFLTAFVLVTLPMPTFGQQPKAKPITIRIGSWNIEHLGNPGARNGPGRDHLQDPRDLADYIQYAKVDILVVQEVTANKGTPPGFASQYKTNKQLYDAFQILNRKGAKWQHVLFPKARFADEHQRIGIAWNAAKVKPVGEIFRIPVKNGLSSQRKDMWNRNCHAMKFSYKEGLTDFVVVGMHLKSNYQGNYEKHRGEEIAELIRQLPKLRQAFPKEEDFIFVGDTNANDGREAWLKELQAAGFIDLNKFHEDTHTSKGVQPYDRIFYPARQPEFRFPQFTVTDDFRTARRNSFFDQRKKYSDHYIVVSEIRIMQDDD